MHDKECASIGRKYLVRDKTQPVESVEPEVLDCQESVALESGGIHFDTNESTLLLSESDDAKELADLESFLRVEILKKFDPKCHVADLSLDAHADTLDSDKYNKGLSEMRAKFIREQIEAYLTQNGLKAESIEFSSIVAHGESIASENIAPSTSDRVWRRVDVKVRVRLKNGRKLVLSLPSS